MSQTESAVSPAPVTTQVTGTAQDLGLLLLRLVFGLLLASHGAQKLFGWFGGPGIKGTAGFFEQMGYKPSTLFAYVAGLSEFGGGLLLAAGLLTPLASAIVIGVMANAIAATWKGGLLTLNGYEMPLLFAVGGGVVAFTGPGRYALDAGRFWQRHGLTWAAASIALGLATAAATLVYKSL